MPVFCRQACAIQIAGYAAAAIAGLLIQAPAIHARGIGLSTPGSDPSAAIASFDGLTSNTSLTNNTYGYEFTTSRGLTVKSLGIFDADFDGLAEDHIIGIWELGNNTALGSVKVLSGSTSPLVNGFRYVDLANKIFLNAGSTYRIGALYLGAGHSLTECISNCSSSTNYGITIRDSFYSTPQSPSLTYPNFQTSVSPGYFGPNFQIEEVPAPLPIAGALTAIGFGRRLRKRIHGSRSIG